MLLHVTYRPGLWMYRRWTTLLVSLVLSASGGLTESLSGQDSGSVSFTRLSDSREQLSLPWRQALEAENGQQADSQRIRLAEDLEVERMTDRVWRHISYEDLESFGRSPANGLVVIGGGEAVLVDTPWNDRQTSILFDWVSAELGSRITAVVPTHSHPDNLGGLGEAHRRGAVSVAYERTVALARESGRVVPQVSVGASHHMQVDSLRIELQFLGGGHTADNIVVWIPEENILFGGCLVRSTTTQTLGWTEEADMQNWSETVGHLLEQYGSHDPVAVPGHGPPGGMEILEHTLDLLLKR